MFLDQVATFHHDLEKIHRAQSAEQAEKALERLYVAISAEDGKLSQEGRVELKTILVEEGALEIILEAMERRYSSPKFYRRACGCLA
jgi:hypothetical protein